MNAESLLRFSILVVLLVPLSTPPIKGVQEQKRVANYAFGQIGTKNYEHLSFWTQNNERYEIIYSYGDAYKEINLTFKGVDTCKGEPCFKIEFSNGKLLHVIPKGTSLRVVDEDGKYNKLFRWEYEGPRNGVGTFCNVCAEDEREAIRLIRRFFVKSSTQ